MKKALFIACFFSSILLSACSNSSSSNFGRFFNKKYFEQGSNEYYEFHETFYGYSSSDYRYSCVYQSTKLMYDYKHDDFPTLQFDTNKNYVYVFAQGLNSTYPTRYEVFGLFYNNNTFVRVEGKWNNAYVANCYISK